MSTEPRSIRLNKAHREDILRAVMQQWEVTNPKPVNGSLETLFRSVFAKYSKVTKNMPQEHQGLINLMRRTQTAKDVLKQLDPQDAEHITAHVRSKWLLEARDADNKTTITFMFGVPQQLADELQIPYMSTTWYSTYEVAEQWGNYLVPYTENEDPSGIHAVEMLNKGNMFNTIVVPSDSKGIREYLKAQRGIRLWEEDKIRMRREVADYLEQFNTTKQIRDGWPEMEQYLPAHIADPNRVINLPVLTRSRLNERLGI